MKRWGFLLCIVLWTLAMSACSNDLTISEHILTDKESALIKNAGGHSAFHYELSGKLPEDHELYFMIEQYEKGEFIGNVLHPNPVNLERKDDRAISFAVITDEDNGKVLYGHPGELTGKGMKPLKGGSASWRLIDKKVTLIPEEPIYLAYWFTGSNSEGLGPIEKDKNGFSNLGALKNQELTYLFKAELKKK